MASPPSSPHAPHGPEQVCPEPPRLLRRACRLTLLGLPFLLVAVLAIAQIVTDAYPRTDATLTALSNVPVPVAVVGPMARWNACVRHRLHQRLEWFWPMTWATVDRTMHACLTQVQDPALTARLPQLRASVAPLWNEEAGVARGPGLTP